MTQGSAWAARPNSRIGFDPGIAGIAVLRVLQVPHHMPHLALAKSAASKNKMPVSAH
jgi:hypothetical protein